MPVWNLKTIPLKTVGEDAFYSYYILYHYFKILKIRQKFKNNLIVKKNISQVSNIILDACVEIENCPIKTVGKEAFYSYYMTYYNLDFMPQEAPTADHLLSDHFSVTCYFSVPLPDTGTKDITFRRTKNIDIDAFKTDLSLLDVVRNPPENLDILVDHYNEQLRLLLDKHAPIVKKSVRLQTQHPWYDQELKDLKSKVRQSERSKNKICGPHPADRDKFKLLRNQYNKLLLSKKSDYYNKKIKEVGSDQKRLFDIVNKLQKKSKSNPLPDHKSQEVLANDFASYFKGKIDKIVESYS